MLNEGMESGRKLFSILGPSEFVNCRPWSMTLMFLALVAGCCGGSTRLTGVVTMNGKPVSEGSLEFIGSGLPMLYAEVQPDGSFTANLGMSKNVTPGSYRVSWQVFEALPTPPDQPPLQKLTSPKKFSDPATSGLSVDVEPNRTNHHIIELGDAH